MARHTPKNQKHSLSFCKFSPVILFFLFTSCLVLPPVEKDRLRTNMAIEPGSISPLFVNDGHAQALASYVFESLIDYDVKSARFEPVLAQSWEVLPDQKTYRFHLRPGVVWQDGQFFSADDVLATFAAITHPDANQNYQYTASQIESVKKIDAMTVEFVYKDIYFLGLINCGSVPILPKHILDVFQGRLQDLFRRDGIGTGPFVLSKWEAGQRVVFERNELYWQHKPEVRWLEIQFIADSHLAFQKLKKGELDFMDDLHDLQWLKQSNSPNFQKHFQKYTFGGNAYSAIAWNNTNLFFKDKRVRQAMTHLFNRQLILKSLKYDNGEVVTGPFLPHTLRYNDNAKDYAYDVPAAVQLLFDAGIKDSDADGWLDLHGQKFTFTMLTNTSPTILSFATIFQEDLRKVGIDMQLQTLEPSVLIGKALKKEFDATFFKWSLGFGTDIFQTWHSAMIAQAGSYNFVSYKNAEVDALIEAAQVEFDDAKRDAIYREVHAILAEDQPYTFLFVDHYLMAVNKRFKNVKMYPQGYDLLEWQVQ